MSRDEILQIARAAGFMTGQMDLANGSGTYPVAQPVGNGCLAELERFAALVAAKALEPYTVARPRAEWHEDMGSVLWHRFPIQEPPHCGTPTDSGWPEDSNQFDEGGLLPDGYYTHFTRLPQPTGATDGASPD